MPVTCRWIVCWVVVVVQLPAFAWGAGDAAKGKAMYDQFCAACHGTSGKGDGPAAAALNPRPRDHTDAKYMATLKDQDIIKVTKEGGAAVGKSPLMPPWGGQFTDQQIQDLVAHIRSLAPRR